MPMSHSMSASKVKMSPSGLMAMSYWFLKPVLMMVVFLPLRSVLAIQPPGASTPRAWPRASHCLGRMRSSFQLGVDFDALNFGSAVWLPPTK